MATETTTPPDAFLEDLLQLPKATEPSAGGLEIAWEGTKVIVASRGKPSPHRAWRRCPTADTELVEVVWIDDAEVLLVRPDVIKARLAARGESTLG